MCSCLISYLALSSPPNPLLFLSLSFLLFSFFLPHFLPLNSFTFSYIVSLSVLLSSFVSSLPSPLFFPFHVFFSLHILLSVCFFNLLCNCSLYSPLLPPSPYTHVTVTTFKPALQDALSHLHAVTEIATSIQLNSSLGASSLPFYQFRHASRYISLCLFFFCYSV